MGQDDPLPQTASAALMVVLASLLAPLALLLLAFLPALAELLKPSDVSPLRVPRDHDNHAVRFATSYRERLQSIFGAPLAQALRMPHALEAARAGAVNLWVQPAQDGGLAHSPSLDALNAPLACAGNLCLPDGFHVAHEIYASGDLLLGAHGAARALLADGVVRLGAGSRVARWVHGREVHFGTGSGVDARVSADLSIELAVGAVFVRANAPTIGSPAPAIDMPVSAANLPTPETREFVGVPGAQFDASLRRWIVFRSLELPAATRVQGDLIVHGNVWLHAGCRVEGSLKAHGRLKIDDGCTITGACIGMRRIDITSQCLIGGPLIGESELQIGSNTVVGELAQPTSVNADRISLRPTSCVHGTVWAKHSVRVVG